MKFVSVSGNYNINISPGTQRAVVHPSGVTEFMPNGDAFSAQFKIKTLSTAEITAAQEQLLGGPLGKDVFGSLPGRDEGNINILDAMDMGYTSTAHQGYDAWQNLSTFDTKDPEQCPPEWRQATEDYLENHYEKSRAYVRIDNYNLTPPWPTYPVEGDYDVDSIVKFASVGGFLQATLVYEENADRRPDLVEALEAAIKVANAEAEERAGLTARV